MSKHGARAWMQVALVFLFMLVNYADKAVIGLSSVPIMRELGLTHVQFGELGSAFFLLFSISGVAVGFLANSVPTKSLMCLMAIVWACALLPLVWISNFGLLLSSRVILGAAEGPSFPVALHAVYKWFTDPERPLPTSIVACGAAFGTGIVAPLLTLVIGHAGWRAAFGALGVTGLVWASIWMLSATEGPVEPAAISRRPSRPVPYAWLLTCRTAVGVFLAGFGAYWVIALNIVWLANYLVKALHMEPSKAAWIIALPSLLQLLLAPAIAAVSQGLNARGWPSRWSRGLLGSTCVVLAGASMIVMTWVEVGVIKILLIGVSFSIGSVIFTLGSTLIAEITPAAQRGAMLGATNSIHTLAGLCAPLAMGFLVDVGANPESGFRTGFLSAGMLVAGLGVAAALLIDPRADLRRFNDV